MRGGVEGVRGGRGIMGGREEGMRGWVPPEGSLISTPSSTASKLGCIFFGICRQPYRWALWGRSCGCGGGVLSLWGCGCVVGVVQQ